MAITNVLVWLGIAIGHTAISIYAVNRWFGMALPHRLLSVIRVLHGIGILVVLAVYGIGYSWDVADVFRLTGSSGVEKLGAAYAAVCCIVAFSYVPFVTFIRLTRRPHVLLHNDTRTVDIADKLGYKPIGRSRYQWMARLPLNQIYQVDYSEKTLHLPRLPTVLDGLTILHLSDLHFSGTPDRDFYFEIMDVCQAWKPDIVAISGDIVDSDHHHRWVLPVLGRLRWREAALAILGNHDTRHEPGLVSRRIRRLGIEMLGNDWKEIVIRGHSIAAIGHAGPWIRPAPDMSHCPAGLFRLCLSHTPDNIRWAREHDVDLMLSGHCHGGQIRLPVIGSLLVPSRFGRRYDCGTFVESPTVLHVVRGVAAQHPLRYNCRPEVSLLTLRCKATNGPLTV